MRNTVIGILAHVDAGKTTLAEAMLYRSGAIRAAGRVDHGDTAMDTHALERSRGITIFASGAEFDYSDRHFTIIDTPGHVDFSAETERTMSIMDYAVLVISGLDGIQSHTRTLWNLLSIYDIPVFIFVTKMDFERRSREELAAELSKEFGQGFVDFSGDRSGMMEELASRREDLIEKYLGGEQISDAEITSLIRTRLAFPVFFGSGLKMEGIDLFLGALAKYALPREYGNKFGASVYKISHDPETGDRITHMKLTGGTLSTRDAVNYAGIQEKVTQIRKYRGGRYTQTDTVAAGDICAVLGLTATSDGQGLGSEERSGAPLLEPLISYRIQLEDGIDPAEILPKLRELEEEDPLLKIRWDSHLHEIHAALMGKVQAEILKSVIRDRFGLDVSFDTGRIMYKETIAGTVEGIGHYEPLRHYAEVHLLLEPLERGRGLEFASRCSEDLLARNWQRLILTHLKEKTHLGVLTGSPVTDMKITLVSGKAHLKHTEGGDFRQATYRAVRQGLMQAESVLLEPWYSFRIEVPQENIGRVMGDMTLRSGTVELRENNGDFAVLTGIATVISLSGYASEIAAYTQGRGRISLEYAGYFECHDQNEVLSGIRYDPEADIENTPDSVFCAHGAGYTVKWNQVANQMHLPGYLKTEKETFTVRKRAFTIDEKELQAILDREFGPVRRRLYRPSTVNAADKIRDVSTDRRAQRLIVDGYNVIFAWDELKKVAESDLETARTMLMNILCNYTAYTKCETILVFDAYKVSGNQGHEFDYHNIHVVYTKEGELGDMYIEKMISGTGKDIHVRVVTSDGLIQLAAVRYGVMRMSAAEFGRQIEEADYEIADFIDRLNLTGKSNLEERFREAEENAEKE